MRHRSITDIGDVDVLPTNVEKTFDNITRTVRRILDCGALPVVLGGDHAITYPVVRAYDEPLHVLHFDAHTDYAPFIHDLRFTNGHAFRHIKPMAHLQTLSQIGIRSLRHTEDMVRDSIDDGNRVVTMSEFHRIGPQGIADIVPAGEKCYVSIDVDVLDPLPRAGLRLGRAERHELRGAA